jgi:hypothetical protein
MPEGSSSAAPVMRPGPSDFRVALSVRRRKSGNLDVMLAARVKTGAANGKGQRAGWIGFVEGLFMVGAECSTGDTQRTYPPCNKKKT